MVRSVNAELDALVGDLERRRLRLDAELAALSDEIGTLVELDEPTDDDAARFEEAVQTYGAVQRLLERTVELLGQAVANRERLGEDLHS